MNISAWAIRTPVPVVLLFLLLTGLGLRSYQTLPITYFPTVDVPEVKVTIEESAASPEEMEVQITKLVEDSVAVLPKIKHIKSMISEGRSETNVKFEIGVPIDRAMSDVRDAVTKIRDRLPAAIDEPIIDRVDSENQPVVVYSVKNASMSAQELSYFVNDVVIRKLQGLPGVGRVELVGTVEREIHVQLNGDRLAALRLTATSVSDQIAASQFNLPSGRANVDARDKTLATAAAVKSLDDLRSIRLTLPQGKTVAVADVATVADTIQKREDFAQLDGEPAIGFTVYKTIGAGDVDVAQKVAAALDGITATMPGTVFRVVDDSVTQTMANFLSARSTLVEGAILAVVVVFLFLRDWRATAIAAISLPLSAIPTFWAIELAGFSLNMLSLLAITLVTGILVDDSIVEIENIVRHRSLGKTAFRAALDASDEIGLAVIAISAAIIAVFAPVGLMGGEIGQYFRQFGLTVAIAVFFSLLVARLVTPLMAAYFLKSSGAPHEEREGAVMKYYRMLLATVIRSRWATTGLAAGLFALSIMFATRLPTEFLPAQDTGRITVSIELAPGSTLAENETASDVIAQRLRKIEDVKTVFVRAGAGADGVRDIRKSVITISVGDRGHRKLRPDDIEKKVDAELKMIADLRFEFINDRGGRAVSFAILSTNGEEASRTAQAILREMRSNPVYVNPTSSESSRQPEIRMDVSPGRAADLGISASQIAEAIKVATIGDSDSKLPSFNDKGRLIPIRTLVADDGVDSVEKLKQLRITTASGAMVPLEEAARFEEGESVSVIQRMERQRRIEIGADLQPGVTQGDGIALLKKLPSVKSLPVGVEMQATGDSDSKDNVFTSFAFAMIGGLSLVMIVLILLFGSPLTPLTIITPLPLAVGGVIASLVVTGYPVSLPVVIGILMLMGIVVKNSIMLVDFAIELERSGLPRIQATIEACTERLRPITMTTLAMAAGMVPAALGHEIGGEFRAPMAVAVIGGLVASTMLSLIVVPAIHVLMAGASDRLKRIGGMMINSEAHTVES
ncbi:efflux RND transporter permease subunit [Mesorhizobium sp. M2E.F.Ca.ET.219.01.1.1]|uniref:efflux RND transporter permease subunit n=1 Tax=Mesorhizobium sp. M2E.F.Ca.ET.219.01.1.1 TaxID=2500530 RepID=UPI000FDB6318|nr:efflux RND transporter permease subunit [Mesorhizobium sp. M2E.F.Ca.ET.219.01.1.1]TGQ04462.1 efflux RND transporter permease subunit [Mesorhizobium sp. M2E.F.Ca.ET.219.01.1.1]